MKKLLLVIVLIANSVCAQNIKQIDSAIKLGKNHLKDIKEMIETKDTAKSVVAKEAESEIPDSSKMTFSKVYGDVKAGISGLASSLKVGAEHVYYVLVKQQVVHAIKWLLILGFGFFCIIHFLKKYKNITEKWWNHASTIPTGMGVFRVGQIILGVIFICIGFNHTNEILTGLINPEYGALQDILNFVK